VERCAFRRHDEDEAEVPLLFSSRSAYRFSIVGDEPQQIRWEIGAFAG
jgi:hypothetical protein